VAGVPVVTIRSGLVVTASLSIVENWAGCVGT
jgi:hypothetical protein